MQFIQATEVENFGATLSHSKARATDHVMKSGILIGRSETWEKVDITDEEAALLHSPLAILTSWAWQRKQALPWVLRPVVYCVLRRGRVMLSEARSLWGG